MYGSTFIDNIHWWWSKESIEMGHRICKHMIHSLECNEREGGGNASE